MRNRGHGFCACCGRPYRSAAARALVEKRAAVIADLKGEGVAEHLRPIDYGVTPKELTEAQAKAARVREYRQTGEVQDAAQAA